MRNALIVCSFIVVGCLAPFASASADSVDPRSVYAVPLSHGGDALNFDAQNGQSLIPFRNADLPQNPLVDQSAGAVAMPASSAVEAIPTPTAFHAGGCLLLLIFVSRCVRKIRWA